MEHRIRIHRDHKGKRQIGVECIISTIFVNIIEKETGTFTLDRVGVRENRIYHNCNQDIV